MGRRVTGDVSVVVHDDELPRLRPGGFDPPITATWSPLSDAWPHLARLLAAAVDGAPVGGLQVEGTVEFADRGSVTPCHSVSLPHVSLTDGERDVS